MPKYTYHRTEPNLWTVGLGEFGTASWEPMEDWDSRDDAAADAAARNGDDGVFRAAQREIEDLSMKLDTIRDLAIDALGDYASVQPPYLPADLITYYTIAQLADTNDNDDAA